MNHKGLKGIESQRGTMAATKFPVNQSLRLTIALVVPFVIQSPLCPL